MLVMPLAKSGSEGKVVLEISIAPIGHKLNEYKSRLVPPWWVAIITKDLAPWTTHCSPLPVAAGACGSHFGAESQ